MMRHIISNLVDADDGQVLLQVHDAEQSARSMGGTGGSTREGLSTAREE